MAYKSELHLINKKCPSKSLRLRKFPMEKKIRSSNFFKILFYLPRGLLIHLKLLLTSTWIKAKKITLILRNRDSI